MSRQVISDAEAKRLLKKLNRRMGAISLLTGGHFSWRAWLVQTVISGVMVGWLCFSGRREDWLLFVIMLALLSLMEIYNAALSQRIDAVVELLQQAGLFENKVSPDIAEQA